MTGSMTTTFETLKRRADFLRTARGRKAVTATVVLQSRRRDQDAAGAPRFGFTATRKLGGAVVRNRIKRRLKEAVRRLEADEIASGRDYVLIGRGKTFGAPFSAIVDDVRSAIKSVTEPSMRGQPARADRTQ